MSVSPASDTRSAPAGGVSVVSGAAASIVRPRTTTPQPSCIAVPSYTRAGSSRRAGGGAWATPTSGMARAARATTASDRDGIGALLGGSRRHRI